MTWLGSPTFAAIALALTLGCAGRPDGAKPTPDDDAAAGNPGTKTAARPSNRPATPATHLVAIAPGDASPCEQMCGQVGDCLQSEEASVDAAATGIEFACLDACVFADPDQPAAREFLACGAAGSCSEVLGCARAHWDEASAARQPASAIGTITVAKRDVCESACFAHGACSYVGITPHDLGGSVDAEIFVRSCTEGCRQTSEAEQLASWWAISAQCSEASSTCPQFSECQMRGFNP